jgi:hypothetical protein
LVFGVRHDVLTLTSQAEFSMLQQIVSHTPVYVWALLAFLIYRGVLASADRVTTLRNLFIIPLVMLGLSVSDMAGRFGANPAVWASWLAGVGVGVALAWKLVDGRGMVADRAAGTLSQRGSWVPLAMMVSVFCTKYAIAIVLAMHQGVLDTAVLAAIYCMLGTFNGIFLGRLARSLDVYLRAAPVALGVTV